MAENGEKALKDLKEFWAEYNTEANELEDDNKIHLKDWCAIESYIKSKRGANSDNYHITVDKGNAKDEISKHEKSIVTNIFPDPFCGNIEKAKFFILSVNPGIGDIQEDSTKVQEWRNKERKIDFNMKGCKYIHPEYKDEEKGAYEYWYEKNNRGGKANSAGVLRNTIEKYKEKLDDKDKKDAQRKFAEATCILESVCYASKKSPNINKNEIESSKLMRAVLHDYLIPKARAGKILIFSWRGSAFWEIKEQYPKWGLQDYILGRIIIRLGWAARGKYFKKEIQAKIADFLHSQNL